MRRAIVFVVLGLLYTMGLGAVAVLRRLHEESGSMRCKNNLRFLGLAALQYADDKRFYPHLGGVKELDGGIETSDGPRAIGRLVRLGYHDGPEGLTCELTPDESPRPVREPNTPWRQLSPAESKAEDEARRRWSYSGVPGDPDPILAETRSLSFGWTRRALPSQARSNRLIMADRAMRGPGVERVAGDDPLQGNHRDGVMTVCADGTVMWLRAEDEALGRLTATEQSSDDALGILDPTTPRPKPPVRWRWAGWSTPGLGLVPLGLLGLLAVLVLRRPEPEAPPPPGVRLVRPSRVRELGPDERAVLALAGPGPGQPADEVTLQAGQRCPVCHDALERAAEPLTACPACRATFHAVCVAPGRGCSTLGCAHGPRKTA